MAWQSKIQITDQVLTPLPSSYYQMLVLSTGKKESSSWILKVKPYAPWLHQICLPVCTDGVLTQYLS